MSKKLSLARLAGVALAGGAILAAPSFVNLGIAGANADTIVIDRRPNGHYERQHILVKPGYYETYRVWVPKQRDRKLHMKIYGHHETRQRWIPDVYEDRDVWVEDGR